MSTAHAKQIFYGKLEATEDVIRVIRDYGIDAVDLRFADIYGHWRSFAVSTSALDLKSFERCGEFPGSAVQWCRDIQESDAVVIPDPKSAFLDPFANRPKLVLICNVRDLTTGGWSALDSRAIAQIAEDHLQKTQIGGSASFRLDFEHRLVREPSQVQTADFASIKLSGAGALDLGASSDVLERMHPSLQMAGVEIENSGRGENAFAMRSTSLTRAADNLMICAYVASGIEARDNGSAARAFGQAFQKGWSICVHQSIWRRNRALFLGDGFRGTSAIMRHYIVGLVEHTPALLDILRLRVGSGWRSELITQAVEASADLGCHYVVTPHISLSTGNAKAMGAEFHCPRVPRNPYLAFAAMLMAGIDGFQYRMYNVDPDEPLSKFFDGRVQHPAGNPSTASNVDTDYEFLLTDRMFTPVLMDKLFGGHPLLGQQTSRCV